MCSQLFQINCKCLKITVLKHFKWRMQKVLAGSLTPDSSKLGRIRLFSIYFWQNPILTILFPGKLVTPRQPDNQPKRGAQLLVP